MKKKQKWLVTVSGYDMYYDPSFITTTLTISLDEGITPIDWFIGKPTVYCRFDFIPDALLNFWRIENNTKKENYIKIMLKKRTKENAENMVDNFF